jgi:hypothetical protein
MRRNNIEQVILEERGTGSHWGILRDAVLPMDKYDIREMNIAHLIHFLTESEFGQSFS